MATTSRQRGAIPALVTGLLLTALATAAPYLDRSTTHLLANHIAASYPTYSAGQIDSAVSTWLIVLSVVGGFGILAWLAMIWAVRKGKPWVRAAATGLLIIGATVSLTAMLVKDTSGETGLPTVLGAVGLLPLLAGMATVALLWTSRPADAATAQHS